MSVRLDVSTHKQEYTDHLELHFLTYFVASATRMKRDTKMALCLSARVWKSLV